MEQVTVWKDIKDKFWESREEAEAAEAGYILDEKIKERKAAFKNEIYVHAELNKTDASSFANYMFANYDMLSLNKLDGVKK